MHIIRNFLSQLSIIKYQGNMVFELRCGHFHVSICVFATCAIRGTSGTYFSISITSGVASITHSTYCAKNCDTRGAEKGDKKLQCLYISVFSQPLMNRIRFLHTSMNECNWRYVSGEQFHRKINQKLRVKLLFIFLRIHLSTMHSLFCNNACIHCRAII